MACVMAGVIGGTECGGALVALGWGEIREVDTPLGRPSGPITVTETCGCTWRSWPATTKGAS